MMKIGKDMTLPRLDVFCGGLVITKLQAWTFWAEIRYKTLSLAYASKHMCKVRDFVPFFFRLFLRARKAMMVKTNTSKSDNVMIISVFLSLRRRRKSFVFSVAYFSSLFLSLSLSLSLFLFDVGAHERNRHSIQAMMRNNGYVCFLRQMWSEISSWA